MTAPADEQPVCALCPALLIRAQVWRDASLEQRAAWKAEGYKAAARVDMCTACRQRLVRNGQLDQYATKQRRRAAEVDEANPWVHCIRCGVPEQHTGRLCSDCVETVAHMGESKRWAA